MLMMVQKLDQWRRIAERLGVQPIISALTGLGMLWILGTLGSIPCHAADWFAAPDALPNGTGSRTSPLPWRTAQDQSASPVQPGDTLWLLEGVYRGEARVTLRGSEEKPIRIQGEGRAVIDSHRFRFGRGYGNLIWENLEFTDSRKQIEHTNELYVTLDTEPGAIGHGNRFRRCIFHDCRNAIQNVFSEVSECLIYYNGSSTREHGIYSQNATGTFKVIKNNIIFHNAGFGIHLLGSDGMNRWIIANNIFFENGALLGKLQSDLLIGGRSMIDQVWITNNLAYTSRAYPTGNAISLGYGSRAGLVHGRCFFGNNTIAGRRPLRITGRWTDLQVVGNQFHAGPFQQLVQIPPLDDLLPDSATARTWDRNNYSIEERNPAIQFEIGSGRNRTFAQWKAETGWDIHSSLKAGSNVRPQDHSVLIVAEDRTRAHLAVWNWTLAPAVNVDLSGWLKPGEHFEVRNAANYYAKPMVSDSYQGEPVRLPSNPGPSAAPIGFETPRSVSPEFMALVILKTTPRR